MNIPIANRGLPVFFCLVMSFSCILAGPGINDSIQIEKDTKRIYKTCQIQSSPPKIDGMLTDE